MKEFLFGFLILCGYFLSCATVAILCRKTLKIENEIFRKILHYILLGSVFVFTCAYKTWWKSALSCVAFIVLVYPILCIAERSQSYSETVTERKKGELKSSLILVFLTFAAVISLCWGLFLNKHTVIAVILCWGVGDSFAALIGKRLGKRKIYKNKTLEGSLAMAITSFITVFIVFIAAGLLPWYLSLVTAFFAAITVSVIELFTPNGFDTVTCPLGAAAIIIFFLFIFGGLSV